MNVINKLSIFSYIALALSCAAQKPTPSDLDGTISSAGATGRITVLMDCQPLRTEGASWSRIDFDLDAAAEDGLAYVYTDATEPSELTIAWELQDGFLLLQHANLSGRLPLSTPYLFAAEAAALTGTLRVGASYQEPEEVRCQLHDSAIPNPFALSYFVDPFEGGGDEQDYLAIKAEFSKFENEQLSASVRIRDEWDTNQFAAFCIEFRPKDRASLRTVFGRMLEITANSRAPLPLASAVLVPGCSI